MRLEINIPDKYYEQIKEENFPIQDMSRLIMRLKEGKIIEDDLVEVGSLEDGTTIEIGSLQMEILDNEYIGENGAIGVLCLTKDILFQKSFDTKNINNWGASSLRDYLNTEYMDTLDGELVDALIPFERNLMTDDGMKDYGTCIDLISLISEREYQDYREYISNKSDWWWTLTALTTVPNNLQYVEHIRFNGNINYHFALYNTISVVPMFLLKLDTKVKAIE